MLSSLTLNNWLYNGVSPEKLKPFDANLDLNMSNLPYSGVILKFNNSVLLQKKSNSLYSNVISSLYIVYDLNNCPRNPSNSFKLKIVYLVHSFIYKG